MNPTLLKILNDRRLVSVMNNTKWTELGVAIESDPDKEPVVSVKFLFEEEPTGFALMNWDLDIHNCTAFEWVDIHPIKRIRVGKLIKDKEVDLHQYIQNILSSNQIPYSIEKDCFRVWGYHPANESPKFV